MTLFKSIVWAIGCSLLVLIVVVGTNVTANRSFSQDVHRYAPELAPNFAVLYRETNIPGLKLQDIINSYLDDEVSSFAAKLRIEQEAKKVRSDGIDAIFDKAHGIDSHTRELADNKELTSQLTLLLKSYEKRTPDNKTYEFVESAVTCLLIVFAGLFAIPRAWYFFLARVREFSRAVRGSTEM